MLKVTSFVTSPVAPVDNIAIVEPSIGFETFFQTIAFWGLTNPSGPVTYDSTGPTPPAERLIQHTNTIFHIAMISFPINQQHPFPSPLPVKLSIRTIASEFSGRMIWTINSVFCLTSPGLIKLFFNYKKLLFSVHWLFWAADKTNPLGDYKREKKKSYLEGGSFAKRKALVEYKIDRHQTHRG